MMTPFLIPYVGEPPITMYCFGRTYEWTPNIGKGVAFRTYGPSLCSGGVFSLITNMDIRVCAGHAKEWGWLQ